MLSLEIVILTWFQPFSISNLMIRMEKKLFLLFILLSQFSKCVLDIICIINIMLYVARPIRMFDSWEKSCQKMQLIIKNSRGQRCSFTNLPLSILRLTGSYATKQMFQFIFTNWWCFIFNFLLVQWLLIKIYFIYDFINQLILFM